jgi:hypothetical protein
VSAVTEAKEKVQELDPRGNKDSLAKRIFVPLAASAASAAAAYGAQKLPRLIQDKLVPKLKEVGSSDGVGNLVTKAKELIGAQSKQLRGSHTSTPQIPRKQLEQIERARRERAKNREARRKALTS